MLSFKQYLILEQKIQESKNKLQKFITQSVQSFRKDMKSYSQTGIKSPALVLLESIQDVYRLANRDLHQTEKNTRALTKFLNDFEKLTEDQQMQLVSELANKKGSKGYIENNEEVKLILIYNRDKNSLIGQEAYNAVVMNKQGMFEAAAQEKVMKGQIRPDQAADYVQEMFLVLCGGGEYNAVNGGANSLDGYDPFSGVPFNAFVKTRVITSAFNKFQAVQNTSVANDYAGYRQGTSIVSTDEKANRADSDDKDMTIGDFIEDETESGRDAADLTDQNMKKALINQALTDNTLPKQYQLTDKEKQFIKLHYIDGLGKKETAIKLGYKPSSAASVARLYLGDEKNEGMNGSAIKHLIQTINYLIEKQKKKDEI